MAGNDVRALLGNGSEDESVCVDSYAVCRAPCVVRRWPNGDSEELGGGARKLEWGETVARKEASASTARIRDMEVVVHPAVQQ